MKDNYVVVHTNNITEDGKITDLEYMSMNDFNSHISSSISGPGLDDYGLPVSTGKKISTGQRRITVDKLQTSVSGSANYSVKEALEKLYPNSSKKSSLFKNLDKDDINRLEHIMSSGSIYVRVSIPDYEKSSDAEIALEVSNTEDFLVYVNLVKNAGHKLEQLFSVQSICNTICAMLTFSGNDVYLEGEIFSPKSIFGE